VTAGATSRLQALCGIFALVRERSGVEGAWVLTPVVTWIGHAMGTAIVFDDLGL